MTTRSRQMNGFTLVEMLMALVVLGIMGLGLAKVFRVQHQVHAAQNRGITATQNARAGVAMLAGELRNAGYDPRQIAGAGLKEMTLTRVAWAADLNADGDTLDTGVAADESVAYEFQPDSNALVRTVGGVTSRVSDGVTNLRFIYRDGDGNATSDANEVEQIDVAIEYETDTGVMAGRIITQVAIRNNIYEGSVGVKDKDKADTPADSTVGVDTGGGLTDQPPPVLPQPDPCTKKKVKQCK